MEDIPSEHNCTMDIELSSVNANPLVKSVITGSSLKEDEAAAGIGLFLLDAEGQPYSNNAPNVRYTYGILRAVPTYKHKFVHWQDKNGCNSQRVR